MPRIHSSRSQKPTPISCKIILPISVPFSSNNYSFYLDFDLLPLYALLKVDFQVEELAEFIDFGRFEVGEVSITKRILYNFRQLAKVKYLPRILEC
jgi:hypothetical protein